MWKLFDPLYVVKVAHHKTFDSQPLLMAQPYSDAIEFRRRTASAGCVHCNGILHPQWELNPIVLGSEQMQELMTRSKSPTSSPCNLAPLTPTDFTVCPSPEMYFFFHRKKNKLKAEIFGFLDADVQSFKWSPVPDHFTSELKNSYFGDETLYWTEFSESCH